MPSWGCHLVAPNLIFYRFSWSLLDRLSIWGDCCRQETATRTLLCMSHMSHDGADWDEDTYYGRQCASAPARPSVHPHTNQPTLLPPIPGAPCTP